jgi:arsenite-transporting ATPase
MEHQRLPGFVGLSIPVAAPNDQVLLRSTRLAGTQQAVLCVARVDAGHWTLSRGWALRTNALVVTEALPSGEARTWLRTRGFPGAALTRKTLTRKQNNESRSGRERVAHAGREQVSCSSLANALDVSESPLAHLLRTDTTTRICLFTGKGGTGKTTTSAAVAHRLASAGLRTLVVSTDPAHSLGDALGVDLGTEAASLDELVLIEPASQGRSSVRGQVQRVAPNLDALEIDITAAAEEFKALISTQRLIDLNKLGLADVQELLDTVPPGADEFVALSLILDLLERYDRVVIDTAPSGHTLRLLSFPDFLDSFLGKLLQLRGKLGVILNTVSGSVNRKQWEEAASKIGTFQQRMQQLGSLLRDEKSTEIVVVTIATELAVRESLRLIDELTHKRSLSVSAVIVNMVLQPSAKGAYIHSMQSAQQEFLERLHQRLGATHGYDIVQVPIFDTEIRTVYGARAFAACLSPLWSDEKPRLRKVVLTAAKGGCGKTTTAGAIGVHLADTGQRTIVVSTDPAHSLGDLFDVKAPSGSYLNDVTLIAENLSILEVDAERALIEFRETLESLRSAKILGLDLDIGDLGNLFDALPPGIDELVALSRVVNLISSEYDHIVIDTAPTGHTLRLLAFPDFLDGLLGRILRLKSKLDGITQFFSGLGGRSDRTEPELTPAQRLSRFREQLMELRDLLHDPERSEVVLVTRPTYLNVVETERLAQALARQRIASHRLVINQVVPPTLRDLERFVHRLVREHGQQIERLQQALPSQTRRSDVSPLIVVPYFDREVRGEAGRSDGGLELFARYLFRDSASD